MIATGHIGFIRGIKDVLFDVKTFREKFHFLDSVKKFNLQRLKNFIASHLARTFGIVVRNIRPRTLIIETVKGCNFNCVMCRAGRLPKEYMSFDSFKRIVDMFPDSFILQPFSSRGEPFLNREIYKMLSYAASKNIYITVTSNFSVIDAEKFLETQADEIQASIDSINPDMFRKIRVNGDFNLVVKNLRKLIELKRKRNYKKPIISLKMVVMKENLDEVEDVIKFGIKEGIERFYIDTVFATEWFGYEIASSDGKPSKEDTEKLKILIQKYKRKGLRIRLAPYNTSDKADSYSGFCHYPFFSIFIDVQGNAFPCCVHIDQKSAFGNIFEDFEGVMRRRYEFLKGFRKKRPDLCEGCPLYFKP
ncbi:MAG: radical SAM/SPASM domain-containing protein [Candidatus Calescibacterium sp.]